MFPSFFGRSTVSALALSAALSVPVIAQEITAKIDGQVAGPGGQPIANARVQIVHTPSGTTRVTSTSASGSFLASGLRVGGPYTITISAGNYQTVVVNDVYLDLDQAFEMNASMATAGDIDEIVITAQQLDSSGLSTGPSTSYSARDIALAPSISRDLKETIRRDPLVSIDPSNLDAISVGGTNNRYNSFTVDGVKVNDDFGLNNGGYPTQRSPVSIDMVEQVSVLSSPFSVEYGGFKGATLNAVTKSGENEFHGSAFYFFRDDSYAGDPQAGPLGEFEEEVYGLTFRGPIIKDKLFFSLGYDFFEGTKPSDEGPSDSTKANKISGVTMADVTAIQAISIADYGFDPGGYDIGSFTEEDEKIFGKIDWNINDSHRASLSYQFNEGNILFSRGTFGGDNLGLSSQWYNKTETLTAYAFHMFSDWSDNFSTEVKIAQKEVETGQDSLGGTDFAQMIIETAPGSAVNFGPDEFRHANALQNETWQYKVKGTYHRDDHAFSFGWEREDLDVWNLFVNKSQGVYRFDSITDFDNQIISDFDYTNAFTNDAADGAAAFGYKVDSFYFMDTWDMNDELTLEIGVRYERYTTDDKPQLNANFVGTYGFGNDTTIDGLDIIMPRLGFNWSYGDSQYVGAVTDIVIRGGMGLFSGGNPNVWLSNTYTNDGVTIVNFDNDVGDNDCVGLQDYLDPVNPGLDLPACVLSSMVAGDGNVDLIDPGFEVPSEWKFSLGLDATLDLSKIFLGSDWQFTFDALFSEAQDPVNWQDLSMDRQGTTFDGRPYYDDLSGRDIMLTNARDGEGRVLAVSIQNGWEAWNSDWDFYMSYANQDVKDVNPGTSSTSSSNLGKFATSDPNNSTLATSNYEIEHRINMSLVWEHAFFGDNMTRASLYGETRSGRPYSYTFDGYCGDDLGDSQCFRDRHLLYVPTGVGDPNIDWSGMSLGEPEAFMAFINKSDLAEYKGSIAPRNAFNSPWVTTFDLHLEQEFPGVMEGHKAIFSIDIENVGNLLNDEWGIYEQEGFYHVAQIVDASYDSGTDTYNYRDFNTWAVSGDEAAYGVVTSASVWQVQFGIKYQF